MPDGLPVREVKRDELEERRAFLTYILDVLHSFTQAEVEQEIRDITFALGEIADAEIPGEEAPDD